jgi:hypothetical protein
LFSPPYLFGPAVVGFGMVVLGLVTRKREKEIEKGKRWERIENFIAQPWT